MWIPFEAHSEFKSIQLQGERNGRECYGNGLLNDNRFELIWYYEGKKHIIEILRGTK